MADGHHPEIDRSPAVLEEVEAATGELELRIGLLWREIRRGAASTRLSDYIYREGPDGLDLGLIRVIEACVAIGPCRVVDLAGFMDVSPSTVSRAVARLETMGMVERSGVDDDRRAVVVEASAAGRARHELYMRRAHYAMSVIFDRYEPDELQAMASTFERLIGDIDEFLDANEGQPLPRH